MLSSVLQFYFSFNSLLDEIMIVSFEYDDLCYYAVVGFKKDSVLSNDITDMVAKDQFEALKLS